MSRWNRSNFYKTVIVDGVSELDLLSNFYNSLFKIKRKTQYYTIRKQDIQRPDLISIKTLGEQKYWWIIAKYNQIDDIWNDLIPGDIIRIPDIQDIQDFYSNSLSGILQMDLSRISWHLE